MLRQHSPRWVALLLAACAHSLICPHSGADALRLSGESRTGTVGMAMSEAPRKRKREREWERVVQVVRAAVVRVQVRAGP